MSRTKTTQEVKGQQITDGIDILNWTVKNSEGVSLTFSTWDFAGQTVYYNTHQVISVLCIQMVMWSLSNYFLYKLF